MDATQEPQDNNTVSTVDSIKAAFRRFGYNLKHDKKTKIITSCSLAAVVGLICISVYMNAFSGATYSYDSVSFYSPLKMTKADNGTEAEANDSFLFFASEDRNVKVGIGSVDLDRELAKKLSNLSRTDAKKLLEILMKKLPVIEAKQLDFYDLKDNVAFGGFHYEKSILYSAGYIIVDINEAKLYIVFIHRNSSENKDIMAAEEIFKSVKYKDIPLYVK